MIDAAAVFRGGAVEGNVTATATEQGCRIRAVFTKLPPGKHGFHIHTAGDLRGEGCLGACAHYHAGPAGIRHGGPPGSEGERHTGDLGNIASLGPHVYTLKDVSPSDMWGRSLIVHEDEDDLGKGDYPDSGTTGHSGKRIGCAIFGRALCDTKATARRTRKRKA